MVLAISPTIEQSPQLTGFGLYEAANVNNILFGRWLKQQEESLSKKGFRELLKGYGMLRREATKLIKVAKATASYEASDLAKLGTMVFSLAEPKYQALWDEMQDHCDLTQEIVSALKKEMFPSKKRGKNEPVSVWRQPPGGGTLYCQIPPIHDQETGVKLERIVLKEGVTPQHIVTEALECYQALKDGKLMWVLDAGDAIAPDTVGAGGTVGAACEDLAGGTEIAIASEDQAYAVEETSPVKLSAQQPTSSFEIAQLDKIELLYEQTSVVAPVGVALHSSDVESQESVVQVEAQSDQAVEPEEQSKSTDILETTGIVSADSETSCALKTDSEQHNAPLLLFPTPTPTDRWREGWKKGGVVVTNSAVPTLPRWVKGEALQIVDVSGPVGSVQRITVINSSFKQYSTYGNWLEDAPLYRVSMGALCRGQGEEEREQGEKRQGEGGREQGEEFPPCTPQRAPQPLLSAPCPHASSPMHPAKSSPASPPCTPLPSPLPLRGGDREWSGKIVKIDSIGRVYHRVSDVDDSDCWTSIKHEFLI